jgi:hypothetical protein
MAKRAKAQWAVVGIVLLLSGCVERRFVVDSNPPGAKVYVNDEPVGFTPVDVPFTYYGTYNITLERDGYQTQTIQQRLAPPWFAYPPIDFVVENLNPFKVRDIRRLQYELPRMQQVQLEQLRQEAEELRDRGRNLPEPENPPEE